MMTKSNLEKNEFISLKVSYQSPSLRQVRAGAQGRNLEAGIDTEASWEF